MRVDVRRAYDERSSRSARKQRSHPIETPVETTPAGLFGGLAVLQRQIGNRAVSALISDVRGPTASSSAERTLAGRLAGLPSLQRQKGNRATSALVSELQRQTRNPAASAPGRDDRGRTAPGLTIQRVLNPVMSPSGTETSGSRRFGARHRTRINRRVTAYNSTRAAQDRCEPDEAQQGLKDLFAIQQEALRWMEGLGNQENSKREGIEDWHKEQYLPELDRVERIFLDRSPSSRTLESLSDRVSGLGDRAVSKRARDRGFMGLNSEVIDSESFRVTAQGLTVYRVVNIDEGAPVAPASVPSYDPRGARSIRPAAGVPSSSEMQSYGHVYFAAKKAVSLSYRQYLDPGRRVLLATYTLPPGFSFKRDPEIPGGFRSTSPMPDPDSVKAV